MSKAKAYETLRIKSDLLEELLLVETDMELLTVYKAQLLSTYQQMSNIFNSMTLEEWEELEGY